MFKPGWIIGKTVARVAMNPFTDDEHRLAHDPTIYFTDGSSISFVTEETEANYGVNIVYNKPKKGN